jgi:hypothetical protein
MSVLGKHALPAASRYQRLIHAAALHFDQIILHDFCRFAAGLRNLLTTSHLQANLGISGDGQSPVVHN